MNYIYIKYHFCILSKGNESEYVITNIENKTRIQFAYNVYLSRKLSFFSPCILKN